MAGNAQPKCPECKVEGVEYISSEESTEHSKGGIRGSTLHIVINVVTFMEFSIKLVYHLQLSSQLFKLW